MKFGGKRAIFIYLTIVALSNAQGVAGSDEKNERNKKHFSLFSVVTFKNEECSSETTFTGGTTTGTCFTATECSDKSGTKSGNCASGFGVCCILISNTGLSATIKENRTHLRNPLYPSIETSGAGTTIAYTINKMQDDICQVRLDFDNFVIGGPANTQEQSGSDTLATNCQDTLTTTLTNTGAMVPILCGVMTGEHLYLDIGMEATDTAVVSLALAATATITVANAMRSWSVKTSQIPCWAPYRAPDGCHRYFMQNSGQIISPNFSVLPAGTSRGANQLNSGVDLLEQHLKTCIRREKGMCCTLFQVCTHYQSIDLTEVGAGGNIANGAAAVVSQGWSFQILVGNSQEVFTSTGVLATEQDLGLVDGACSLDYVEIPDSGPKKNFGSSTQVNTRYCGPRLGMTTAFAAAGVISHQHIYDCTEPWEVTYHTTRFSQLGTYASITADVVDCLRGMCLEFQQEAC
jgi:hypothetical protein